MQFYRWYKKYFTWRLLSVFLLGFFSGLPLPLVAGTLQAWLKTEGIDLRSIGYVTLVTAPYSFKFLWSVVFDRFCLPWLDRRRGWIIVLQFFIIVTMLGLSFSGHSSVVNLGFNTVKLRLFLAFLLAFFSASQDLTIDAYRIELLDTEPEKSLGIALAVEGYRLAMLVATGTSYILAGHIGWANTYGIMSGVMALAPMVVLLAPPLPRPDFLDAEKPEPWFLNIFHALQGLMSRKNGVYFLILAVIYKLSDAFANSLVTPFLLDLDFSLAAIGTINKLVGLIGNLIGVMCGGIFLSRTGLYNGLLTFAFLQVISNFGYFFLALAGKNYSVAAITFFVENLCSGMGTAAIAKLFGSLCQKKYMATQLAILTSLASIGRLIAGPIAAKLVGYFGWLWFFSFSACLAIPTILLLQSMKQEFRPQY